jgi:signal peptidase II
MSISSVAIIAIALYLYSGRNESKLYCGALTLIISGGIGNMIDRIALGYVVDFIDFALIDFAVFNIADSFVCIGAGLLVLALILDIIKEAKLEKAKRASGK